LHSFVHDTLSGKCWIAVQQNGNHVAPIFRPIATVKLPRRAFPTTTGSTHSKCDGFATRLRWKTPNPFQEQ
jgi:hypothetical protein